MGSYFDPSLLSPSATYIHEANLYRLHLVADYAGVAESEDWSSFIDLLAGSCLAPVRSRVHPIQNTEPHQLHPAASAVCHATARVTSAPGCINAAPG